MGDRTTDYVGQVWYKESRGKKSFNRTIKVDETCNLSEIVEVDTGEILPFNPADAKEIDGIFMGNKTKGDETGTNADDGPVWTDFPLMDCYMSGVAEGDEYKPVWASGATSGAGNKSSGDLDLAYSVAAKLLGCIAKYKATDRADVWVEPKKLEEKFRKIETLGGLDGSVPAADAFFGIVADFDCDIIVTAISYIPSVLERAGQGFDVLAVAAGNVLTGLLKVLNADTVHTRKRQAITDHANCYIAEGAEFKFECQALEGAAPDLGMGDFFVHYLEVPKFDSISD